MRTLIVLSFSLLGALVGVLISSSADKTNENKILEARIATVTAAYSALLYEGYKKTVCAIPESNYRLTPKDHACMEGVRQKAQEEAEALVAEL